MKEYLIGIKLNGNHAVLFTTINGDSTRPFQIANNLWNYTTPWHAGQRLEILAKEWETRGYTVKRFYGTVWDMPTKGHTGNVELIRMDYEKDHWRR